MKMPRGCAVRLEALDAGATATPDSVTFHLNYPGVNRSRVSADVDGEQNGADWSADWDSSVAYPGTVFVSVMSVAGTSYEVADGSFQLTANVANPDPLS